MLRRGQTWGSRLPLQGGEVWYMGHSSPFPSIASISGDTSWASGDRVGLGDGGGELAVGGTGHPGLHGWKAELLRCKMPKPQPPSPPIWNHSKGLQAPVTLPRSAALWAGVLPYPAPLTHTTPGAWTVRCHGNRLTPTAFLAAYLFGETGQSTARSSISFWSLWPR